MFTGIIEEVGEVVGIKQDQTNVHLTIKSSVSSELKIDQSIAHNGVCLTVVEQEGDTHVVTAIQETLDRSNIGDLQQGDSVNLERCTQIGARLDGHIVQGHVDQTGTCDQIEDVDGSTKYWFTYESSEHFTVEKGSITVNGVSLTVVDSETNRFSVAIIPYTQEHTNFNQFKVGTKVNLEFDVIGKYVSELMKRRGALQNTSEAILLTDSDLPIVQK